MYGTSYIVWYIDYVVRYFYIKYDIENTNKIRLKIYRMTWYIYSLIFHHHFKTALFLAWTFLSILPLDLFFSLKSSRPKTSSSGFVGIILMWMTFYKQTYKLPENRLDFEGENSNYTHVSWIMTCTKNIVKTTSLHIKD